MNEVYLELESDGRRGRWNRLENWRWRAPARVPCMVGYPTWASGTLTPLSAYPLRASCWVWSDHGLAWFLMINGQVLYLFRLLYGEIGQNILCSYTTPSK